MKPSGLIVQRIFVSHDAYGVILKIVIHHSSQILICHEPMEQKQQAMINASSSFKNSCFQLRVFMNFIKSYQSNPSLLFNH